jgi:glutamate/tyrosine decarboxylase-like PLP-dependent enzyme
MNDVLARLRQMQSGDLPVHGGRTLAYVYDSGLAEVDEVGRAAVAAYAGSNGLDPTAFPSLLRMENELVGFACTLLDAPGTTVGTISSGGTESVLLAVQAARDAHPEIAAPRMVIPSTAHAAFHKAAHYFGVEAVAVPVGPDFRADAAAMAAAIDDRTVLVVASAPSYAHGVVDPVTEIAAAAAARGVRCHVDACIGGWVLPYAARLGRPVPPWTFAVEGVTSISVDLHKYAYAPKGTSILLHRTPALRAPQFFASADWPGYTMLNATLQSTKSGGPLAAAWAVVNTLGDTGYETLSAQVFEAVDRIVAGIGGPLRVVVPPDSTLVALATDDTCDPFTVCDEMASRGWYVQPQMSYAGSPATIHLSVSAATLGSVDDFLTALGASVQAAVEVGPVRVDPDVVAFIEALDPAALSDDDFDGLLAASGLVSGSGSGSGGLDLPERMAEVNALLDVAAPAMREALLKAFLDRLSRPVR